MTAPTAAAGALGRSGPGAGRRSTRRAVAGLLLVCGTVVTFWQVDARRSVGEQVLAVTRPVPAGAVIGDADVRVVRVAGADRLDLVAADRLAEVVGGVAAVPLAPGSLLTAGQLGPVAWPPAGQAVVAVPVKAGRAPTGLAAGARVVVLVHPADTSTPAQTSQASVPRATATVMSVSAADPAGGQTVTLLLDADAAETLAASLGEATVMQLGPGR